MATDPDATLGLLSDMASATDEALRAQARRLAARIILDTARRSVRSSAGSARLESVPLDDGGGDVDLDATLPALVVARASRGAIDPADVRLERWRAHRPALALVIDRSGSMSGPALAAAAVAVAAVAAKAASRYAVVAFNDRALTLASARNHRPTEAVIDDVLRLRGHGPTNLDLALRAADDELASVDASERRIVLLSDGRSTVGPDPTAPRADLLVIAPAHDPDQAADLARRLGGRSATMTGPSAIASILADWVD